MVHRSIYQIINVFVWNILLKQNWNTYIHSFQAKDNSTVEFTKLFGNLLNYLLNYSFSI